MTNKEAIEVLKANYPDAYYELLRKAVDMAIEALSEPSRQGQQNGLISHRDAIEAIDEITWYHQNANKDMVRGANSNEHQAWYKAEDVYKALESVPSAQPDNRLAKIADLVEGTIDHFELDDAMDLIYQIKDVLK